MKEQKTLSEEAIKKLIREEVRKQLADIVRQMQMASGIARPATANMEYKQ